jgi:hypothetical protein
MLIPTRFAGLIIGAAALLVSASSAQGALTLQQTQQKCQAGKNKAAGKYAACRQNAEAKLATTLATPGDLVKYNAALDKCAASFLSAWPKLDAKAAKAGLGFTCLDGSSSVASFQAVIGACTHDVAEALGGAALPACPIALAGCQSDLATCQANGGATLLETNQTTCYDTVTNVPRSCTGTGQDGEFQKGLARSYTDNSNGTITDNRTGLVWEKLADDGTLHDKDTIYAWGDAFGEAFWKIQQLNTSPCFADQCDWRLPNVNELHSILDYAGTSTTLRVATVFNTGCTPGCLVTACSCATGGAHWSSTTDTEVPELAWEVLFDVGYVVNDAKVSPNFVRAVRGGA